MADPERRRPIEVRPTIREPFTYPGGNVPNFPQYTLDATQGWASSVPFSAERIDALEPYPDELKLYLTWLTEHTREDKERVGAIYRANERKNLDLLPQGSWLRQRNASGMNTCQLASSINAFRFLGIFDPSLHTEARFIQELGGNLRRDYAREHPAGATSVDLVRVISVLAPQVNLRGTNSVADILEAVENGAAAIIPVPHEQHVVLIPPGHRLRRGTNGQLEVQVADSLRDRERFIPVDSLIQSEITPQVNTDFYENSVVILEIQGSIRIQPSENLRHERRPIALVEKPQRKPIRLVEKPYRKPIRLLE